MSVLWAILLGCGPSGDTGANVQILTASTVGTPGGRVYVLTAGDASQIEVSIDGKLSPSVPYTAGLSMVTVPAEQPLGAAMLATHGNGDRVPGDQRVVEIVAASFRRVERQTGLQFEHDVTVWSDGCAQALTGVGFADIDGDGDLDAFVGNLGAPGTFFRNLGDTDGDALPDFVEDTAAAGLGGIDLVAAVSFADFDNDGDPDLFVGRRGRNVLLINDAGVFSDVTDAMGLIPSEQRTMGGGWGDWDGDGDLDLFVSNHAWCFPTRNEAVDHKNADHFYRNDGDFFTELTSLFPDDAGQMSGRFGFVSLFVDYDRDNDQDLFVINDIVPNGGRSIVWQNQGPDQGFAMVALAPDSGFSPVPDAGTKSPNLMGVDVGDLNDDGRPDFAYSNIGHNGLVLSSSSSEDEWVDGAEVGGVWRFELPWYARSITWATHLFDYDNDGDLDLMYIGGELRGNQPQPHAFFENRGDNTFVDRTWQAGLESHGHGKASALLDLDGDGLLEMVVANWAGTLEVYRNDLAALGNRNHWLQVDLRGDGVAVSRDAFGAIVELTDPGGRVQTCFRNPRPSLSSTGDPMCHFGLGSSADPVSLRVVWPDGAIGDHADIAADQRIEIAY